MNEVQLKLLVSSLLFLGLFYSCVEVLAADQCTSLPSMPLKLNIVSLRNDTGHWTATIKLNHEASHNVAGPFELDVEHYTVECGPSQSVHIETVVRAPPTQPQPGGGYELMPGVGLHKFYKVADTWFNAEMTCVKEGAHLLVLSSDKEFVILKKKWDESGVGGTYMHFGINDFDKEGTFVTVTGEAINSTGYVKWLPGEPNSGNTANCGAITRDGAFVDSVCANKFIFFCKKYL